MFHSNEYQMKQRLHDLQEEYFSYKMERLFRPKKKFFWKKFLKQFKKREKPAKFPEGVIPS